MSGLSDAGRIHLRATWSISSRTLGAFTLGVSISSLSKHSLERFSSDNSLSQSVRSTTPGSAETISGEPFPVRSSNKITPNA
uniref:Uncharacterized protein n=1 Tax=Populus trichocarpa TaxID=3694 RepID=U5G4B7_POPTR